MTYEAYSNSNINNPWGHLHGFHSQSEQHFPTPALLHSSGEHCGVIVQILQSACWREICAGSTTYEP